MLFIGLFSWEYLLELQHSGHLRVCGNYNTSSIKYLPQDVDELVMYQLNTYIKYIINSFGKFMLEDPMYQYHNNTSYSLLNEINKKPLEIHVDKVFCALS